MLPASQRVPERGLCYREPELRKWYCHSVCVLGVVVRGQGKKRGAKKEKREKRKRERRIPY